MLWVRQLSGCSSSSFTPTAAARWTTTSASLTTSSTTSSSSTEPSTKRNRGWVPAKPRFWRRPVESWSSTSTLSPRASSVSVKWEPMNPAPPVMRYVVVPPVAPACVIRRSDPIRCLGLLLRPSRAVVVTVVVGVAVALVGGDAIEHGADQRRCDLFEDLHGTRQLAAGGDAGAHDEEGGVDVGGQHGRVGDGQHRR